MNSNDLKKLIKEQVNKALKEDYQDKYKMEGMLITDLNARPQQEIYSDIRALPGVTIVSPAEPIDYSDQDTSKFKSIITVKVDGYLWVAKGGFGKEKLDDTAASIRKVPGVKSFTMDREKIVGI